MLDPLVLAPVAILALAGLVTGLRARLAGLIAAVVALTAWLALVPPARELVEPRTGVPGEWIALAGAALILIVVSYALRVVLGRRRAPRARSRAMGTVVGAAEGVVLSAALVVALALAEPSVLARGADAATYPAIHTLAGGLAPRAPEPIGPALAALARPTPRAVEIASEPPRPVPWIALPAPASGAVTRTFTGTVRAGERAPLAFEIGGTLASVSVRVGETVEANEVLARLDDDALQLAVEERRAALVETEAVLREAELNFDRQSTLLERRVVAPAALDNARAARDSARARTDAARSALARAEDTLADAVLRAPFAGRIASQLVEASEVVAGGAPVFEIEDADATLEVVVDVPESVVGTLRVGQRQALLGRGDAPSVDAAVTEIGSRRAGEATFPITLEIGPGAAGDLRPGSTRRIALDVPVEGEDGVLVPSTAVVAGADGGAHIFVVEPTGDGVAEARREPVRLIAFDGADARIETKLPPGTPLAMRGAAFLRDGQDVALIGLGIDRFEEFGTGAPQVASADPDAGRVIDAIAATDPDKDGGALAIGRSSNVTIARPDRALSSEPELSPSRVGDGASNDATSDDGATNDDDRVNVVVTEVPISEPNATVTPPVKAPDAFVWTAPTGMTEANTDGSEAVAADDAVRSDDAAQADDRAVARDVAVRTTSAGTDATSTAQNTAKDTAAAVPLMADLASTDPVKSDPAAADPVVAGVALDPPLDVATVQVALNALGFDAGVADGLLGPNTRTAIRAFQRDAGLEPTGEPGAELTAALRSATRRTKGE